MKKADKKPLYQMLIDDMLRQIYANEYDADRPFCTEKELTEKYNVSKITAKRAIQELEQVGILYRKRGVGSFVVNNNDPEAIHLKLKNAEHKTLAMVIPYEVEKGGFFEVIKSATEFFHDPANNISIHICERGVNSEKKMLETVFEQNIGGLVYYPSSNNIPEAALDRFVDAELPVIIIDKQCTNEKYSNVVCDNYSGGYQIAEHLLAYGHRNTCFLSVEALENSTPVEQRFAGIVQCFKDKGVNIPPTFFQLDMKFRQKWDYPFVKHVINTLRTDGITALLCANDRIAFHVIMCCNALGIKVPEDLSVTGFDDSDWATMGGLSITTARQGYTEIGHAVSDIYQQKKYRPTTRVIPVKLIPRDSTGNSLI